MVRTTAGSALQLPMEFRQGIVRWQLGVCIAGDQQQSLSAWDQLEISVSSSGVRLLSSKARQITFELGLAAETGAKVAPALLFSTSITTSITTSARPPPHSLWSKSAEGSESECLIWWPFIWWDVQTSSTIGNIQTWWPPQLVWGHKPYPRLQISTTSNSVFRNILGSWCIEMFSQIFSTSISRHRVSLSWQLLTLLYTVANVLKSESDSFFWLLSPDPACYGTPLAVPQNIFQPKISTPYFYIVSFLGCWRWHWWQCWKSLFVGLETSGEVRRVYNNTEQIFLTFLFEDFLTMNFLFEVGLERGQQL